MKSQETSPETDAQDFSIEDAIGAAFDEIEGGEETEGAEDATPDADIEIPESDVAEAEPVGNLPSGLKAPGDLTADEAAAWAKLTPEAQKLLASYALRSQQSRTGVATELDGLKKRYEPVGKSLERYQSLLEQLGATPDQVISGLMPYYAALATGAPEQKRQALDTLARHFGVDLAPPKQTEADEYVDPEIAQLRKEISELKRLSTGTVQTFEQMQRAQVNSVIENFKAAKDEKGSPKHPYFERVESRMEQLIRGGAAVGLDDAYALAIRLDEGIQKELAAKVEQDKRLADLRKAKEAEKAKSVNKKGATAPARKAGKMSILDSIEEAYDELAGA